MKVLKIFLPILIVPAVLTAQNISSINDIAYRLVKSVRAANAEKVVLITNKKSYSLNETIYFKALLTDSLTGRLTNRSKILYADLVDANNKVIHSWVLDVSNGPQSGNYTVDSSLDGYYWFRAYTKNMLAHNMGNISVHPVYVFNTKKITTSLSNSQSSKANETPVITIYPEGGNIMSGAQMLFGIKVLTENGNAIADSGFVKNNKGVIEARFLTNERGIGKFSFEPSIYKTYSVFLKTNGKYDSIETLQAVNPFKGQVAIMELTAQNIKVRVLLEDSIFKKDYTTFLIGLHNDSICFAATGRGMYELNLPASNFPSGVSSLFLFNENGELLSKRNFYIDRNDLNININTDKQNYAEREQVNLHINITNDKGNPVLATLAIAVNDNRISDTVNDFTQDTLQSLSAEDADLIMLTQQNKNPSYLNDDIDVKDDSITTFENGSLYISGLLTDKKENPVPLKPITLLSLDKNNLILQDTTDKSGKFSIVAPPFNAGTAFSVQIDNAPHAPDAYNIILDPVFKHNFKTPSFLKQKFSNDLVAYIKKEQSMYADSAAWLPHVTVTTSNKKINSSSRNIITKEMLHSGRYTNVGDAILQTGVFHIIGGYLMTDGSSDFGPSPLDEPIVVVDGVQTNTAGGGSTAGSSSVLDFLKTIPVSDIDHIKLVTGVGAATYGIRSGSGVIEIYTLSQPDNPALKGSLKIIYPKGFDAPAPFTMPDYTNKQVKNSKEPDTRTTIYWNGNILTDANGNASANFFTADAPAVYNITVKGITANGIKFCKTITINRK